ncbi:hypothetical protein [Amycolatopsis thailandensis]|uniref:hypothetical protein n=1 Tax=Amycolatopsis thailandensis TaxID=589330 RepID=UPI00363B7CAF
MLHVERDGVTVTLRAAVESFASQARRKVLRDRTRPGMVARRHLEMCVFSHLAAELRSGDIALVGADSYADFTAQLLAWEDCEPRLAEFCEQAGIPAAPHELVAHFREQLADAAETTDAGFQANADLRIVEGRPVLTPRRGGERSPSAIALEQAIHRRLPERSLLDILTRAAYLTGWHRHLGPASGSDPKIRGDRMGRYVLTRTPTGPTSARPRSPGTCAASCRRMRSPRRSSPRWPKPTARPSANSTLEGLNAAARKGNHGGRSPVITDDMLHTVLRRRVNGESLADIRNDLIIPTGKRKGNNPSRASIYRALAEHEQRQRPPEAVKQAHDDFAALQPGA